MTKRKGKELETLINKQNNEYFKSKKALIRYIEVPIKLTAKGFIAAQSTVDYTGCTDSGEFIAFDAKEVSKKNSLPLAQLKQHQIIYLQTIRLMNGFAFFAVWFKAYHDQIFITPLSLIEEYLFTKKRKSIVLSDFKEEWLTDIQTYLDKVYEMEEILKTPHPNFNTTTWGF